MKNAPTLADTLYRMSFKNETIPGWTSNAEWRAALQRAKKFVLDDAMSTFLGELGTRAFLDTGRVFSDRDDVPAVIVQSPHRRNRKADHLRMGARLPSEVVWIEYNLRKCQERSNELLGRPVDLMLMPEREGWLIMQHPHLPTAYIAQVVAHDPRNIEDGLNLWTFPVALAWTVDDETILPWRSIPFAAGSSSPSEVSTGLVGYKTDRAGYVFSPLLETPDRSKAVSTLLREWSGVQRRMWALLATITDLPVEITEVRAAKGFVAKGSYRKFLDHRTITITVPKRKHTKIIRDALAMAHRRGGPVISHWRKDWRNPLSPLCDHDYGADEKHMFCTKCHGRKIWIAEHVRGDTSRGFVTHDFLVTHAKEHEHGRS